MRCFSMLFLLAHLPPAASAHPEAPAGTSGGKDIVSLSAWVGLGGRVQNYLSVTQHY